MPTAYLTIVNQLSIADLYAVKSQAKEKESYYRQLKNVNEEFATSHDYWVELLNSADRELVARLTTLPTQPNE